MEARTTDRVDMRRESGGSNRHATVHFVTEGFAGLRFLNRNLREKG
jgi:hypothetical protein